MFTIEVKKREADEEFGFEDLEIFHQECYGGKIESFHDKGSSFFYLRCSRCGEGKFVYICYSGTGEIIRTAIDGQKRNFGISVGHNKAVVIQKS